MSRVAFVVALVVACGDDAGPLVVDGGPDSGPVIDAAVRGDAGGLPPTPLRPQASPDVSPPPERYEDPFDVDNAGSCYDGEDNDYETDMAEDDGLDCDDVNCVTLSSCCVGRPQHPACCPIVRSGDLLASLDTCTPGGTPLDCLTGATAFGAPTPFVDDGLALGGDGMFDSGLLFDDTVDLRTSTLDVDVAFRQAECAGSCRESAAFGITTQDALDVQSHVDPEIALVVSGERREARLLIGDDVAALWSDVADGAWRVVLRPDGVVLVGRDGAAPEPVATYVPSGDAHVVVWGHSRNPGATEDDGIRIERLDPRVRLCDIPRAWRDRNRLFMQITDEVDTTGATSPSVVLDAANVPRMAFAQNGVIHLATQENPSRPERWARDSSPVRSEVGTTFSAPELVHDGSVYRLYYFAESGETRTWMMASGDALENLDAGTPVPEPATGFEHPSIVPIEPPDRPERFAMAAMSDRGIETFSSEDGEAWNTHALVPIELLDTVEVAQPSLAVVNGGYQLSVAVRRGARWSIAMFASAELVHWRLVDERALEAGEGTERVGVRDLELYVRGTTLEAVYVGNDGVRETFHHAQRAIPNLL